MCLKLKQKVAVEFNVTLEQVCLIHSGQILDDAKDLIGSGIVENTVVHMVVKTAPVRVSIRDAKLEFFPKSKLGSKNRVKIETRILSVCPIRGLSIGLLRGVNNYRLP